MSAASEGDPGPLDGERRVMRVRKRNGRVVAYEADRIRAAVGRAQDAVGEQDTRFPSEVEEVVGLALATRYQRLHALSVYRHDGSGEAPIPEVEEIQDLVERALIEMGHAPVAKAYILYRDRRARARSVLEVVSVAPLPPGQAPLVKRVDGNRPWSQAPIVTALMNEAELPRELAETVAERTERRVLDAGLRYVSTALVRELVDNELLAMGLSGALHRQERVGLPRHDLRGLFQTPRAEERADDADFLPHRGGFRITDEAAREPSLEDAVAAGVLSRFAFDETLDEASAESHRAGDLHFEDLARPHCALVRSIPVGMLLRREPGPTAAFELLDELAPILSSTAYGVVVEGIAPLVATFTRARDAHGLTHFLTSLGALARGSHRSIGFSMLAGRAPASQRNAVRTLLLECARLAATGAELPRLYMSWNEVEPALQADGQTFAAAEQLLARGILVPTWNGSEERWVAPGCRRRPREQMVLACGGAVALHLPRLARRAGAWREDLLLESVAQTVEACIDGLERFQAFQAGCTRARGESLREQTSYAVTPVGLREALRILGDGEERVEQGARLLGLLSEAVRRYSQPRGLSVVLSPFFGARARRRMAALDRAGSAPTTHQQPRLFADLPAPELPSENLYTSGYHTSSISALEAAGVLEARLFATVPSGALFPLPATFAPARGSSLPGSVHVGTDPAPNEFPGLDAWRRFDALRPPRESRGLGRRGVVDPGPLFQTPPSN